MDPGNDSGRPAGERTGPPAGRPGGTSTADRNRPPGRAATVIGQQPWWKCGTPEQRRALVEAIQAARQRAHDRKARVRAHPDLADRLCRTLGYQRFDQWSGYVPPGWAWGPGGDTDANASPVRAELIAVLRLVAEREKAGAAA